MKVSETIWRKYLHAVEERQIPSFRSLGLPVGQQVRRGFAGTLDSQGTTLIRLTQLFDNYQQESKELDDERKLVELSRRLYDKVTNADIKAVSEILEAGFPINYQEPRSQWTILHEATATALYYPDDRVNAIIDLVLSYEPDLLIQDDDGRLALHNCVFFRVPEPAAETIRKLTHEAAKEAGVDLAEDFKQYYQSWMEKGFVSLVDRLDERARVHQEMLDL